MEAYALAFHVPIINAKGRPAFLKAVREACPKCALEIGTAIGYSALLTAANGVEDIHLDTLEHSVERARAAQGYIDRSPWRERIHLYVGDAGALLADWRRPEKGYDFVFIDAAKGQYADYFRKVLPLLADEAVILADNVLFRGYVRGRVFVPRRFRTIAKRLREYLELAETTEGCHTEILEAGDGLAVTYYHRPR